MKYLNLRPFYVTLAMLLCAFLMLCLPVFAQLPTDVENTSVAVNLDRIVDDTGWGVLASTPLHLGVLDGYVAGIAQGGDIIRGKYHAEVGRPIGSFGFRVYTDGTFKGYTLDGIGRQQDVGLAIDTPDVHGASIRVGLFGRNAGEFGPPNARGTLEDAGYDPNALDGLGLESLTPAPAGLSFKAGNSLNALVAINFDYAGVSFGVKAMPEITGEGDPAHQGIVSAHISRDLTDTLTLDLGAEVGTQLWNDEVEYETAYFIGIGVDF